MSVQAFSLQSAKPQVQQRRARWPDQYTRSSKPVGAAAGGYARTSTMGGGIQSKAGVLCVLGAVGQYCLCWSVAECVLNTTQPTQLCAATESADARVANVMQHQ